MAKHAKFSPSGAEGWSNCSGWESDPTGSDYANWGTAAHDVAAMAHTEGKPASAYQGRIIRVEGKDYEVDAEMVEVVQVFLDACPQAEEVFVERAVSIAHLTGEIGAEGTADRIAIAGTTLYVDDLKTGRGVLVDAFNNKQLALYGQAAVDEFSLLYDIEKVSMRIIQPRVFGMPSEWVMSVADLAAFVATIKPATEVKAGEEQCRWCAKKATCPTLNGAVQSAVAAEFDDLTTMSVDEVVKEYGDVDLGLKLSAVDMIEDWCKAVRAEALRRLEVGTAVPGFKLVAGKKGNRTWRNAEEAEQVMKSMRLKQEEMYDFKLISPTTAEKLAKAGTIGPRQWPKLQGMITQADGGRHVAPESDKRPAIAVVQFEALPEPESEFV